VDEYPVRGHGGRLNRLARDRTRSGARAGHRAAKRPFTTADLGWDRHVGEHDGVLVTANVNLWRGAMRFVVGDRDRFIKEIAKLTGPRS